MLAPARLATIALVTLLLTLVVPTGAASAHGVSATADLQLAQSFAGNELTVVIRRTPAVPGPLQVDVIAHDPVRPAAVELGVRGIELGDRSAGSVRFESPGLRSTRLRVEAAGSYELTLSAGGEVAVIPFRVLVPTAAGWEYLVYGGFTAAGLLMLGGIACAVARWSPLRALAVPLSVLVVVALAASGTTALLSKDLPPAEPRGGPDRPRVWVDAADGSAPNGRPYANLTLRTEPPTGERVGAGSGAPVVQPRTGEPFRLVLRLTDGNTGRPVDDVAAHHAALIHLVVTSQTGREFRHTHPARVAAGAYALELTVRTPGRWLVHAEFERADSGSQLVTGTFTVTGQPIPVTPSNEVQPRHPADTAPLGTAQPAPAPTQPPTPPAERRPPTSTNRLTAPPTVDLRATPARAVAGRPITVTARVSAGGRPAADLQPWLGMAGHLVIRDTSGSYFGHVHELTSMSAQQARDPAAVPDETVAAEGPDLRFTFSLPGPGRYLAWIQFAREYRIHTVPFTITVSEGQP